MQNSYPGESGAAAGGYAGESGAAAVTRVTQAVLQHRPAAVIQVVEGECTVLLWIREEGKGDELLGLLLWDRCCCHDGCSSECAGKALSVRQPTFAAHKHKLTFCLCPCPNSA